MHEEKPFIVNGNVNHGVDFVLSDGAVNIFVECKTKRLNLQGRIATTADDLDAKLVILAEAIVQNYRNIKLAVEGRTHWMPDSSPCVNLVVTLEDWYLVSPDSHTILIRKVQELLARKGIDSMMLDQVPFAILSAEKFEVFCCAAGQNGIETVVAPLFRKSQPPWSLAAHLDSGFAGASIAAGQLFLDEFQEYGRQIIQITPYVTRRLADNAGM